MKCQKCGVETDDAQNCSVCCVMQADNRGDLSDESLDKSPRAKN